MHHRPPACRAFHHIPSPLPHGGSIQFALRTLEVSQAHAPRRPPVQTQGRGRFSRFNGVQDRRIHGHVAGTGLSAVKQNAPGAGGGHGELMDSGQWTVDSGQWTVDSGQWTVDSGQWAMGNGAWGSVVARHVRVERAISRHESLLLYGPTAVLFYCFT